jgi:hypothetical protein
MFYVILHKNTVTGRIAELHGGFSSYFGAMAKKKRVEHISPYHFVEIWQSPNA